MKKIYDYEYDGQIDFFKFFRINYESPENKVLIEHTDGVVKGNLLEFKLNINNINATLFQAIKYLSKLRIKGIPVPANILLISLNDTKIYYFKSQDYFEDIHKIYFGPASKNNEGFTAKKCVKIFDYSIIKDSIEISNILKEESYMKIDIDENCIVGWAEKYYRENPGATKADIIGDDEGLVKIKGEIREPVKFKDFINPYTKKTNERFKYLMDVLNDNYHKKEHGAFYTPIAYCEKVAELVREAIRNVPEGNDYVIIDRCAGTGNLESVLTEDELSRCILSTYEYFEYKVLLERLGEKVLFIIPPREDMITYSNGVITNADALTEDFINLPEIKQYIDDPKITIILLENPPYHDSSADTFKDDTGKRAVTDRKGCFVAKELSKEMYKLNEKRGVKRDKACLFIWSGFKYYLRQPTDSYIILAPVKYFKHIGLVKKKFVKGFAFNKLHFHAKSSVVTSCVLWRNIDDFETNEWKLDVYDIKTTIDNNNTVHELVNLGESITVKENIGAVNFYNDLRKFEDDVETDVVCNAKGYEHHMSALKKGKKPIYNKNIIGYLSTTGYLLDYKHCSLVRCNYINGLSENYGYHLRTDNYLEKLPIFCSKCCPMDKWYHRDVYYSSSDKKYSYVEDADFLKSCLIYTCLSEQNKCISFTAKNGRFYKNELCFDFDTIASNQLESYTLTVEEKELLKIWNYILEEIKKTKNYNPSYSYGIYQIKTEINTTYKDERNKSHYDYPILNGYIATLESKLKEYYLKFIWDKMFYYELIK